MLTPAQPSPPNRRACSILTQRSITLSFNVNPGYTIGIDGLAPDESRDVLLQLFKHQLQPQFIYRHTWQQGMLTLWDNRSLLHAATGGYEGHRRLLYRVTVAERA